MKDVLLLLLYSSLFACIATSYTRGQQIKECEEQFECAPTGCCRNSLGKSLPLTPDGPFFSGTCREGGRWWDECDANQCNCNPGLLCFSASSRKPGVCKPMFCRIKPYHWKCTRRRY